MLCDRSLGLNAVLDRLQLHSDAHTDMFCMD